MSLSITVPLVTNVYILLHSSDLWMIPRCYGVYKVEIPQQKHPELFSCGKMASPPAILIGCLLPQENGREDPQFILVVWGNILSTAFKRFKIHKNIRMKRNVFISKVPCLVMMLPICNIPERLMILLMIVILVFLKDVWWMRFSKCIHE